MPTPPARRRGRAFKSRPLAQETGKHDQDTRTTREHAYTRCQGAHSCCCSLKAAHLSFASQACCVMIWAPSLTRYLNAEQELRNLDFQSPTAALVHEEEVQPQRRAEQENERDGVGEKAGKDSALVLGPGSRRLCVAEKEHERDGKGQKDVPSEHSRPNASLGLVHTRVQTHAPPCDEEGQGKGVEGATGGGEVGGNTNNRGAKGKMAKRCEGGLKRGDRKERDKRQIKGNHILVLSLVTLYSTRTRPLTFPIPSR
jgi:hypothetical protein